MCLVSGSILTIVSSFALTVRPSESYPVQIYHLFITYPGCRQTFLAISGVAGFAYQNIGIGGLGTKGVINSGESVYSTTDADTITRIADRISL